jgi:uncharacterized membrane protein YbhN (UPF0104 family)
MKVNHKGRVLLLIRSCVAVFLMGFLVFTVGIDAILKTLVTMDLAMGVFAWFCLITLFFLGGFNIWLLLNSIHAIPFFSFLKVYADSWVTSLIVPGQAGDASIIFFLKSQGVGVQKTSLIYMLDKSITLFFFLAVSFIGAHFVIPDIKMSLSILLFPLVSIGIIGLFLWGLSSRVPALAKTIEKLDDLWLLAHDFIRRKWYILVINTTVTIIKWLVTSLGFYLAFLAFGIQVNIYTISVLPILSTLVGYIPVSIAGIGTVEMTATFLFSLVNIQQAIVLNAYLLLRVLQYGLAILLLGAMTLIIRPKS